MRLSNAALLVVLALSAPALAQGSKPASKSVGSYKTSETKTVTATVEGKMNILGILGADPDVRNGFSDVTVHFDVDADATPEQIEALVAQSQKRSAVFDLMTNPTKVVVNTSAH